MFNSSAVAVHEMEYYYQDALKSTAGLTEAEKSIGMQDPEMEPIRQSCRVLGQMPVSLVVYKVPEIDDSFPKRPIDRLLRCKETARETVGLMIKAGVMEGLLGAITAYGDGDRHWAPVLGFGKNMLEAEMNGIFRYRIADMTSGYIGLYASPPKVQDDDGCLQAVIPQLAESVCQLSLGEVPIDQDQELINNFGLILPVGSVLAPRLMTPGKFYRILVRDNNGGWQESLSD